MKAVIQRVARATVSIQTETEPIVRTIGQGIVVLLGVKEGDTPEDCDKLAEKCAYLRIFDDESGHLNVAATDLGYEALVVSNFTLYGDTRKGKRPSFTQAAKQPLSETLYNRFVQTMLQTPLAAVQTGVFGAEMQIELVNDGPITLVLDTEAWKQK